VAAKRTGAHSQANLIATSARKLYAWRRIKATDSGGRPVQTLLCVVKFDGYVGPPRTTMLGPEDQRRVEELLRETLALPADQRAAFVQRACGDNDELRVELKHRLALEAARREAEAPGADASPWAYAGTTGMASSTKLVCRSRSSYV